MNDMRPIVQTATWVATPNLDDLGSIVLVGQSSYLNLSLPRPSFFQKSGTRLAD